MSDLFDKVGGIQSFNRSFINALESTNNSVIVIALSDKKNKQNDGRELLNDRTIYKPCSNNKFLLILYALYYSLFVDAIVFGHVNLLPVAIPLIKRKKILIIHGIDVWRNLPFFQKAGLSLVQTVLSVSTFTKEKMKLFNPKLKTDFQILPNTLSYKFENQKADLSTSIKVPKGNILFTVSRLSEVDRYKNIDLVIKSLPIVLKNFPETYLLVAGDGNDKERLKEISKLYEVSDNVIFFGEVDDNELISYFKACDIFILPSLKEGFGIVFLEAMYYSKPCIGADVGGIPEVIENNKTGILCYPNDITSLTNAIITLLKDKELRLSMGIAGKERFEREFSFEKFKNKLKDILCQ